MLLLVRATGWAGTNDELQILDFARQILATNAGERWVDSACKLKELCFCISVLLEESLGGSVADECARARMIEDISNLLRESKVPDDTRIAGLALIGWLARRMPGEVPHKLGVEEARRQSEKRIRVATRRRDR